MIFSHLLPQRGSLRTQLILWNIVALAILLGVLGVVIRYTVSFYMLDSIEKQLKNGVRQMPPPPRDLPPERGGFGGGEGDGPFFGGGEQGRGRPDDPHHRPPPRDKDPYSPHHFDLQGKSILQGDTRAMWDRKAFDMAIQSREAQTTTVEIDEVPILVYTLPHFHDGRIEDVLQAAYPLTEMNRAIAGLNGALIILSPFAIVSAGLAGAFLTDRVLRRVRVLTQSASLISARNLSERLPTQGNDEFSALATAFNTLLSQLQAAFQKQENLLEQQRRFTADASHELKTPLTVIKGTAGFALSGERKPEEYKQTLQEINRASDQMAVLVQDLLYVARSDAGQLGREPIEILVREILESAIANVAPRGGAPITLKILDESLSVRGNEGELIRLFSNLLDNAVRYTPENGQVTVTAKWDNRRVVITVSDTGIGIAPEHLSHLGERFYRVDTSRTRPTGGTGLGLAICKGIVEAHHGAIHWESTVGVGTIVTVSLAGG